VPDVSFGGMLLVELNTTASAQGALAANSFKISGNAMLTVAGQQIGGFFLIQRDAAGRVAFAVSNLSLSIGDGGIPYVQVMGASGVLLLTGQGVALDQEEAADLL